MSPLASAPDPPTRLRSAVEIGFVALGVLVAVGVAALFLALTGASRTGYPPRPQSPTYVPLMQYPGAGPPADVAVPRIRRQATRARHLK
jgi:hypothetical protein